MKAISTFILISCFIQFNVSGQSLLSELLTRLDTTETASQRINILDSISEVYEQKSNFQMALVYTREANGLKDSVFQQKLQEKSQANEESLGLNKARRDILMSKNSIAETAEERTKLQKFIWIYRYLIIGIIALLILIVYKIHVNYRLNKEISQQKEATLKKYKTLEEAYANTFNVLETLSKKAEIEENKEKESLPNWVVRLSKKELEVLAYLSVGMTDKEISNKMNVSLSTVRTYCRRVYSKLLVKNRSEAANFANKYQLV
ncbi:MAG: DNA-binding CsgD family transcriptional regulator [Flavobacteriaceae bacterium]|jgi:DNA-binding CsgD family transcriptional regulator